MKIVPIKNYNLFSNYDKSTNQSFKISVTNFSNISFTSDSQYLNSHNHSKEIREYLKSELSQTFLIDRNFVNKHYFGNINDKNKFSKYGYYVLDSKNKSNLNERQLSRNYEIFYNKNLKSLYDVGSGVKEYSEITLKNNVLIDSWFKYFNISNIDSLNNKIREEYNKGTLDNLIRYSIKNNFEQNCQKFPLHNVIIKDSEFAENSLSQNKESIHNIFIVINDYINNSSVNEYSKIYKLLDNLAEGLYENNDIEIKNSYKKILNIIKPYYTKNHKQVENKNLETIKNFQNSANYQILNRNYNLDLLFGTNTLSIDEKMFLFNKKDKIYGIDLYKFLIDNPTNNKTRKQIINNLMLCENADKEAFKLMKKIFINDVNSGNTENLNSNLLNSVLEQIPNIDNTNLITNEDKIKYLQKFPNEELNILLENIKSNWLEKRTEEAFELEAEKYDINARFDKLAEDITVKIDGTEINLYNTINKLTEDLSKQMNISANALGKLIVQHDKNMTRQFVNQNRQMEKITEKLYSNSQESKELEKKVSLILDQIEQKNSQKKREVDQCRATLRKMSGLASLGLGASRLIFSQGFDFGAISSIFYGLNMLL